MAYASSSSADYLNKINELSKPTYTSKYDNTISSIMDKIVNREDFSYDFNADPLYQNYKDQYTKLGNEAAQNAAASVSALTGGYGNSYAATAASQANQQYLTKLNDVIPDLYNAALNKYNTETENLYNQFDMYETEENRQYGQYRDNVTDYYSDLSDLRSGYSTALGNEQWQADFDYQKERDAIADSQWAAEMAYQAQRDSVSDSQWETNRNDTNFWNNLNYLQSLKSSSSSKSGSSGKSAVTQTTGDLGMRSYRTTDTGISAQLLEKLSEMTSDADVENQIQKWVDIGYLNNADADFLTKTINHLGHASAKSS